MSTIPSPLVCLRPEQPGDEGGIRQINESAYGRRTEADLIEAARDAGAIRLSTVAVMGGRSAQGRIVQTVERTGMCSQEVIGGELVGHALFTPVTVTTDRGDIELLGMGPVAVLPAKQHNGIGTMMISGCLEHLRVLQNRGVVVIGELGFFRRFGFIPASRWGLRCATEVPDDRFLVLELTPGALAGVSGSVRYRPELTPTPT
jgi:putative acetyltransferase